jgi:hypothetical protein
MTVRRMALLAALAAVVASVGVGEGQAGGGVPIFACGQTVFQNAVLTADLLDCPGDAIVVGVDGVTIDLKGFTVDGTRSVSHSGVLADGFDRVTVKNGVVRDFGTGVRLRGVQASVSGVVASGNVIFGLEVDGDAAKIQSSTASGNGYGIFIFGDSGTIQSSTFSGNGNYGIAVIGDAAKIQSSTVSGNGGYGMRVDGDAALIKGNRADGNGFETPDNGGLGIDAAFSATPPRVGKNVARGNDDPDECDPAWLCGG